MHRLRLSLQLLLLSGIPFCVMLVFAGLLAARSMQTWHNVEQIEAMQRLIGALEECARAIPNEAITSLAWEQTGAPRALIAPARARTDAALANLSRQAVAAGLHDPMALASLHATLSLDLPHNRGLVDAGRETLPDILATMRPATLATISLIGRLAALSTDAALSRLILAYNVALTMNDAMLVERNVRPIEGSDGRLAEASALGEAVGIAQQDLLTEQFERLAAPALMPVWHRFLSDRASVDVPKLRRSVLGLDGGHLDPSSVARWSNAVENRLHAMAPVLEASSASLRARVAEVRADAAATLASYAALLLLGFGVVVALVPAMHRQLARRIRRLSLTMRRLAGGELDTVIPPTGPLDELGEMTLTLASFKASLIERDRLAIAQAVAAAALQDEKERLRVTLHSISDGMIVTGADRCVTMMNAAAEDLTGWRQDNALGADIDKVLTLTYAADSGGAANGTSRGRAGVPLDLSASALGGDSTLRRPDGVELAIDASAAMISGQDGKPIGSITVLHDVTESRMLMQRIRQLAHFDTLTGLPNRALFHDRLAQAVLFADRSARRCALMFMDMDRFKHVNDTLGHAVGDLLLREVGHRLALTIRESDTVARLGGDEFVMILNDMAEPEAAAVVARKVLASVGQIDSIAGHAIDVSFSIGIAIYPDHAHDAPELLQRADAAMYRAKQSGRNTSVFFDPADEVPARPAQAARA